MGQALVKANYEAETSRQISTIQEILKIEPLLGVHLSIGKFVRLLHPTEAAQVRVEEMNQ